MQANHKHGGDVQPAKEELTADLERFYLQHVAQGGEEVREQSFLKLLQLIHLLRLRLTTGT